MAIDAVLLLAFGGPTRPEEVPAFLANVARGRAIPPERLELVARQYAEIGGRSPLNARTFAQAEALRRAPGMPPVYVGMRNWAPYVADTLTQMTMDGVRRALAIVLSPHANEASRERYVEAVEEARAAIGPRAPAIVHAPDWHVHPRFVEALLARLGDARAQAPPGAPVLFTAHSIPCASAAVSPYERELAETAAAVARAAGVARWQVVYQSRSGHPRAPWLEPDVNDALRTLAAEGTHDVVVAPIGFVCDHVEVLYDLDVMARRTAASLGLGFVRAQTVNDHPAFIAMLADLVRAAHSLAT